MLSEITEDGIKKLVDAFYGKVRKDPALGPVFNGAIAEEEWPKHLETLCAFWSSIILKTDRYQGNPMKKHMSLPGFEAGVFDRWLQLFSETAREIFAPEAAEQFESASQNIARSLKYGLYGRS